MTTPISAPTGQAAQVASAAQKKLPRILCVDDEPRVLDSLLLTLRRDFDVHTASSGEIALTMMKKSGPYAVICSDMRMPVMNGAALLNTIMQIYPDTTRILLTGEAGRDAAVAAVNEGQIFRFLTKPCPPAQLKAALEAGVKHHLLVTAEKVLLQETLVGSIRALVDVLAITNPVAFGRANRVKRLAMELAGDLGFKSFWQLEAAAMFSQLGYMSLPVETVEKMYYGQKLTPEEQVLAGGVPKVAERLLARIPRLEGVLQILQSTDNPADMQQRQDVIAMGTKILSLVLDYDTLIAQLVPPDVAISSLQKRHDKHDTALVTKLAERVGAKVGDGEVQQVPLRSVHPGMTILDELRSEFGVLLVPRGFEVTESFCIRMRNFSAAMLNENVRVMVGGHGGEAASNVA